MTVYHKLVRDRIPEIIEASGRTCVVRVLDDQAYLDSLHRKLEEELQEYLTTHSLEELADLLEVAYAIAEFRGVRPEQLEQVRREKREARGGFRRRLFLLQVSD
ncbi:nucleoside triphosphate pyrophosphohydrolase [Symbiobacterium thermophilum]|uniref:Phosphoribosyl-ATP pyrophosphohydrolase n=1 Tax=Symbiobacterium thermophilum TaxID=2734 RepID=A0A953I917_SYMTR|nr:nucleoside triphosphate pyrophosphohydrolase [Symbiobacterium thermophilum]MBY6275846.1 phosphoribosyl-ATP pyrophosphohydrolase [Symbiobacterium thermophilum]